MQSSQIALTILVKGKPVTEYQHENQTFIEGRAGSEYEIEIKNKSHGRVEAIISVDGLSITDGSPAGPQTHGYLLTGHETLRIPGWKLNSEAVAKFAFAGKKESYATQMSDGDTRNNGVIGVMVYSEKVQWRPPITISTSSWNGEYQETLRGLGDDYGKMARGSSMPKRYGMAAGVNSAQLQQYTSNSVTADAYNVGATTLNSATASSTASNTVSNSLGTAFGDSTAFATRSVSFDRAVLVSTLMIYYDDKRGLKARGIDVRKPKQINEQPNAFPGMDQGCAPPPNWRG